MKKLMRHCRFVSFCLVLLLMVQGDGVVPACAEEVPYDSYNYDYREYVHFTPAPYVPEKTIGGAGLTYNGESIGAFQGPQDVCKSPDGEVYLADSGNSRIIVLNETMSEVKNIITEFDNAGMPDSFKQPSGVCVSEKGDLYVADSLNHRVVVLNADGALKKIIQNPESESLPADFMFVPQKVAVDYADRVYVIAQNMFEGIMVFENTGEFTGFFGTINVTISLWEKFWKRIATKEERSRQQLYIPTEFTGIDVDEEGFIYATNITSDGIQGVRRLNPKGQDVIKKGENENVGGDLWSSGFSSYSGPSQFVDVVYRGNGIYSCLDRKRGRIFTYDYEGNLLYIFGGLGTQRGTFTMPSAIEQLGDKIVALDSARNELIVFKASEYGSLINEAVTLRFCGDETEAVALWERVLELDENNELANTGIGKAYLTAGDYVQALKYLEIGMNRDYYSIAFRRYRNEVLAKNANLLLTGLLVLIVGITVVQKMRNRKKEREGGLL